MSAVVCRRWEETARQNVGARRRKTKHLRARASDDQRNVRKLVHHHGARVRTALGRSSLHQPQPDAEAETQRNQDQDAGHGQRFRAAGTVAQGAIVIHYTANDGAS